MEFTLPEREFSNPCDTPSHWCRGSSWRYAQALPLVQGLFLETRPGPPIGAGTVPEESGKKRGPPSPRHPCSSPYRCPVLHLGALVACLRYYGHHSPHSSPPRPSEAWRFKMEAPYFGLRTLADVDVLLHPGEGRAGPVLWCLQIVQVRTPQCCGL